MAQAEYTTVGKWFEIWVQDKEAMLDTMWRNYQADLDAGYKPDSHCIRKQIVDMEEYRMAYHRNLDRFSTMADADVNKWCYYDLRKRGVI